MRVAIPSETDAGLDSPRSGHFGHTPFFTIVTVEDGAVTSVETVANVDHDAVGCGGVIDFALGLDLDAIVVVGMGRPPFMRFTQGGIAVLADATASTVGDVVAKLIAGKVPRMDSDAVCAH
ncbi:MAG: dinitrogenase iron-molybdenum cofactor biosynthesis protein [Atopobiaceae bacterium]|nr:dinitrogenase iron-molybdenum cofactor biosynthesis protein [Atopobiaceae bacterium]MCI2173323.1 dinitrogenase iron-molybdenum cofactor biosynthesis protein [Atopobiaceae bacterium]MCI2207318.1 dinitrogenase iron-molybdenum cofactor biosynthesis protein [Atopobiaceae bacterium]